MTYDHIMYHGITYYTIRCYTISCHITILIMWLTHIIHYYIDLCLGLVASGPSNSSLTCSSSSDRRDRNPRPQLTGAPDNQFRQMYDWVNYIRNASLLNVWGWGRGSLFHRWHLLCWLYICVTVCVCVGFRVYIYIYTYMCIYIYIYIYVYTHI